MLRIYLKHKEAAGVTEAGLLYLVQREKGVPAANLDKLMTARCGSAGGLEVNTGGETDATGDGYGGPVGTSNHGGLSYPVDVFISEFWLPR